MQEPLRGSTLSKDGTFATPSGPSLAPGEEAGLWFPAQICNPTGLVLNLDSHPLLYFGKTMKACGPLAHANGSSNHYHTGLAGMALPGILQGGCRSSPCFTEEVKQFVWIQIRDRAKISMQTILCVTEPI